MSYTVAGEIMRHKSSLGDTDVSDNYILANMSIIVPELYLPLFCSG